jgi:hypothetical protein
MDEVDDIFATGDERLVGYGGHCADPPESETGIAQRQDTGE